ncbi:MAG: DUF4325 domain-containing protein [bacterium]
MATLKEQILRYVSAKRRAGSSELMEKFGVSRQAIHRHLTALLSERAILKQGSSRRTTFYVVNEPSALRKIQDKARRFQKRLRAEGASEDRTLSEIEAQAGLLAGLSTDALANAQYAFTEMLNNAIEHSGTTFIDIELRADGGNCSFYVRDTGVGIFANIQKKFRLASEMDALAELLKGKQTTAPKQHSGEGIFFTSKIVERFVLESHGKRLIVDNRIEDVFVEDMRFKKGTRVVCEIDTKTRRKLVDLFAAYTSEEFAFEKTRVTVKLFESGESYVSRSQAKRLLHSLERFIEVVLDFSGVASVGQAFCDEVFRVFQQGHPDIRIVPVNMNENVEFMVRRAVAAKE